MSQNFIMLLVSWGVLALIVLVLAVYRNALGRREDDSLHVSDREAALVTEQNAVAHRIDAIEKWGKSLTVVMILYGLALGAYYLYTMWQMQSTRALVD